MFNRSNATCSADVPLVTPADAQRTLHAIERGSESDRFDGLLRSGETGAVVPEDTLKTIVDTDASERVRLLAFERLIERLRKLNFVPKKRKKTRPTLGAKKRRLEGKRQTGTAKRLRGRVRDEG